MNLKNILQNVCEYAVKNELCTTAMAGLSLYEINFKDKKVYPIIFISPSANHTVKQNYITYSLRVYYMDRLLRDNSNNVDVVNASILNLQRLINIIRKFDNVLKINEDYQIYNFADTQRLADLVAGSYVDLNITILNQRGECEIDAVLPNIIINKGDYLLQSKDIDINKNGEYKVRNDSPLYDGLSEVNITVNVPTSCEGLYEQGYEEGKEEGYQEGKTEGIGEGYQEGYKDGKTQGKEEGKEYQKSLLENITITQNGTYNNENGYDVIEVNVPNQGGDCEGVYEAGYEDGKAQGKEEQKSLLEDLNVTENGTYTNENGYKQVVVNVPTQGGDCEGIYEQGYEEGKTEGKEEGFNEGYDSGFSTGYTDGHTQGKADQKALLEDLEVKSNGTYTNENGYKQVVVNVPTSGGDCEGVYEQGYEEGKQDIIDNAETLYVTENGTYSIERTITGYYDDGTPFYDYAKVNNLVFPTGIQVSPDTEVEVWFKTGSYMSNEGIVASQNAENLASIFKIVEQEGHFSGEVGGQQPNIFDMEGAKLEINKWYHLKMSYNDGLWVNGKQVGTYEASNNVVPPYFELFINGYSNQEWHSDTGKDNYFGMVKINGQTFIPKEDTFWNITEGYGLNQSTMGENPYYEFKKDTGDVLKNLIKEVVVNVPTQGGGEGGDCEGIYEEGFQEGYNQGKEEGKKDAINDADTLTVTKNGTYSIREITGYYEDGTPFYDYAKLNNMAFGTGVQVSTDTEIELWFKTSSNSQNGAIIGSQRQDNINAIFKLTKGDGHFSGEIAAAQLDITDMDGARLELNKWYHLKMSHRDGLWVNGKQVGTYYEDRNVTEPCFELFINGISNMNEWYDNTGIENYFGMVKINGQTFIPKEDTFWNITEGHTLSTFVENENGYYEFTKVSEEKLFENLLKEVVVNVDTQSYYSQGFNEGYEIGFGEGRYDGNEESYNQGKEEGIRYQKTLLKTLDVTENGTYQDANGYKEVNVDIDTQTYFNQGKEEGKAEQKSLLKTITITGNGTYQDENGYKEIIVNTPINDDGGYDEGYNNGYTLGLETGFNQGKEEGIAQGKEDQKTLLEDLEVTENGTYTNENGYKQVNVNIPLTIIKELSMEEYNALEVKDNNTIYLINS